MDPEHQPADLREYLAVLRGRKWTIIFVTILVLGAALAYSYRQTPTYQATSRILLKGVPADLSGAIAYPNVQTEAEVVRSQPVAALVVEDLDLDVSPDALINSLQVVPAAETATVLNLTYTSTDPSLAAEVANSFAANYIEYKRERAEEVLDAGRESLEAQLEPVQEQLSEITRRLNREDAADDPGLVGALETERAALIARLGVLQQRIDDYQIAQPLDLAGGEIIEPATQPAVPSSPNHLANGVMGAFLGVIAGIALAFLRERLDDRLRGRDDLERVLHLPVLATVPRYPSSSKKRPEIITISQPHSSASEAYRSLRTNVQFLSIERQLRSLVITSPSATEGKTVTAINLSVAFAQAGHRVVLVSADLRRPTLEHYFGIKSEEGLTNWLMAADKELWGLIRDPGIDNLRVIPSGPLPANPAELLSTRRLNEVLNLLEQNADLVIIDSPPALAVADAAIISTRADAALLVVDARATHRSAAVRATEELQRVGAPPLGSVLNGVERGDAPYYYQGYYSSGNASARIDVDPKPPKRRSLLGFRR